MTRMPAPTRCARGLLAALVLAAAGCALRLGAAAATFETGHDPGKPKRGHGMILNR